MPTIDDPFDDIVAGLDLDDNTDDVVDVTALNDLELVDLHANVRQDLLRSGEMPADDRRLSDVASTPEGRRLHSLRIALEVELRKRDLI